MYIYLSNENDEVVDVFFDDLTITHQHGPIIQQDDYYPFGLTFNSYQRENSVKNRIKFQGQEHIDDLDLGWDQFKWRNHMPDIGRFFNVDPLAEKYSYNSPYAFSENKVVAHIELEGLEAIDSNGIAARDATNVNYIRKPLDIKPQNRPVLQAILQIGPTDITSGRAFTQFEKAGQLGADIGQAATGVYALKNLPNLVKSFSKLAGSLDDLSTFTKIEKSIIKEANGILRSDEFVNLQKAFSEE